LLELHFADQRKLAKQGRSFKCEGCPERVQKIRRCRENRWDFTAEDHMIFPLRISEGGGLYGFCPGKVTWDHEAANLFEILVVAVEQKKLLVSGGIADQPGWFINMLAWFGPAYDQHKFISRAKMVLGDDKTSGTSVDTRKPGKRR
jgi:hypothetical protein